MFLRGTMLPYAGSREVAPSQSTAGATRETNSLILYLLISYVLLFSVSARFEWSVRLSEVFVMPLLTFDRVLKIISTILNILSAALAAFGSSWNAPSQPDDDSEGHA